MAIFNESFLQKTIDGFINEGFLDRFKKKEDKKYYSKLKENKPEYKKKDPLEGKTVYKPYPKGIDISIGNTYPTYTKQVFETAKEACALIIEDAFNVDYPENSSIPIQVDKSAKKNLTKQYEIYKATIVSNSNGFLKIKLESLESSDTVKALASKYGYTIDFSSTTRSNRAVELNKVISLFKESTREAKNKYGRMFKVDKIYDKKYYESEDESSYYWYLDSGDEINIACIIFDDTDSHNINEVSNFICNTLEKKIKESGYSGSVDSNTNKLNCYFTYKPGKK